MTGNSLCHYNRGWHLRSILCPLGSHSSAVMCLIFSLSALVALELQLVPSDPSRRWEATYSWGGSPRHMPLIHNLLGSSHISPKFCQSTSLHWGAWRLPGPLLITHGPSGFARLICVVKGQRPDHQCRYFSTQQLQGTQPLEPACSILLLVNRKCCWA